jgi:hypothetical protein
LILVDTGVTDLSDLVGSSLSSLILWEAEPDLKSIGRLSLRELLLPPSVAVENLDTLRTFPDGMMLNGYDSVTAFALAHSMGEVDMELSVESLGIGSYLLCLPPVVPANPTEALDR